MVIAIWIRGLCWPERLESLLLEPLALVDVVAAAWVADHFFVDRLAVVHVHGRRVCSVPMVGPIARACFCHHNSNLVDLHPSGGVAAAMVVVKPQVLISIKQPGEKSICTLSRAIDTPLGNFYAVAEAFQEVPQPVVYLTYLKFLPPSEEVLSGASLASTDFLQDKCRSLLDQVEIQVGEYFDGARVSFDLPLAMRGTDFQVSVWKGVRQVRFSYQVTYSELAERLGCPKSARAVGAALGKNPIWIVVPCHRVIGKSGRLVGFAGGLECKRLLLELERGSEIG